jgi:uncharacterized protein (DUF983 family)
MLLRGAMRRCPRCGSGGLFKGWFRMVEHCPRCGYQFEREEGFFLGAYVINLAITQVALGAFIAVGIILTLPDPPPGKLTLIGIVVAVGTPLLAYPFAKTIWTAFDLIMHPEFRKTPAST